MVKKQKTLFVRKLKNSNCDKIQTQMVTILKNSNCDKTKKTQIVTKLKL